MSGATLAHVISARSRFVRGGAELATAQPIRKCVTGLTNADVTDAKMRSNSLPTDKSQTGDHVHLNR